MRQQTGRLNNRPASEATPAGEMQTRRWDGTPASGIKGPQLKMRHRPPVRSRPADGIDGPAGEEKDSRWEGDPYMGETTKSVHVIYES